ncbi:MAG: hypothetical protein Kow0069_15210 [Promethearchaeota archaeon]
MARPAALHPLIALAIVALLSGLGPLGSRHAGEAYGPTEPPTPGYPVDPRSTEATTTFAGVGNPRNVSQYGRGSFAAHDLNATAGDAATVTVPANWTASRVQLNVTRIHEFNRAWLDEEFTADPDPAFWKEVRANPDPAVTTFARNASNDAIYFKLFGNGTNDFAGFTAWNFSVPVDRLHVPYAQWTLSFRYLVYMNDTTWQTTYPGGSKLQARLNTGLASVDFNLELLRNLQNGTWYSTAIPAFSPELYGLSLPNDLGLGLGVYFKAAFTPNVNLSFHFTNVSLVLATQPRPSQVNLTAWDVAHGASQAFVDGTNYGEGSTAFSGQWGAGAAPTDFEFQLATNSTGDLRVDVDALVDATSLATTTTETGTAGSHFSAMNGSAVAWTLYFSVEVPGTYQDGYHFNVSKPTNWNVVGLVNPYGVDKVADVAATAGPGNDTLVVPSSIVINGRWKILAESPNYVFSTNLTGFLGGAWEPAGGFNVSTTYWLNVTVDTSLVPDVTSTTANAKVFWPNGSEWTSAGQAKAPSPSGLVQFDPATLGAFNATPGEYALQVSWNGGNASQVGFRTTSFVVLHRSRLERAASQAAFVTPVFSGDVVILKVNFSDLDSGAGVPDANVTYSVDGGLPGGTMLYAGGGVYSVEVDTTGWSRGVKNFTFTAEKPFYHNVTGSRLVQVEVTESTSLTSPQLSGVAVGWGRNFTLEVQYNATAGGGIDGAVVGSDWVAPLHASSPGGGRYVVEFSTAGVDVGTYLVKVNASADGFENQEVFVPVTVRSLYTNLTFEQPAPVPLGANVTASVMYWNVEDDVPVTGATITVKGSAGGGEWPAENYQVDELGAGRYDLTFNSTLLGVGTHVVYVEAAKPNHATATTPVSAFVDVKTSQLVLDPPDGQVRAFLTRTAIIRARVEDAATGQPVAGLNVTYDEPAFGAGNMEYDPATGYHSLAFNTSQLGLGLFYFTLRANGTAVDYQSHSAVVTVEVAPIPTLLVPRQTVLEAPPGTTVDLFVNFLVDEDVAGWAAAIPGANVTFFWSRGEGTLRDLGNGTYSARVGLPRFGVHSLTVTAVKDAHQFALVEVTLVVKVPGNEGNLALAWTLVGALGGVVAIFAAYNVHFKYPPDVREVRRVRRLLKKLRPGLDLREIRRSRFAETTPEDAFKPAFLARVEPDLPEAAREAWAERRAKWSLLGREGVGSPEPRPEKDRKNLDEREVD